jgi:hypothetical protein
MLMSIGENNVSEDDELTLRCKFMPVNGRNRRNSPHPDEILHHKSVNGFGGMCHIHLPISVSEICLSLIRGRNNTLKWRGPTFSIMYVKAAAWSR